MKKGLMIGLIVFLLCVAILVSVLLFSKKDVSLSPAGCTDSDGGKNYVAKGSTKGTQDSLAKSDRCINSTLLNEQYCGKGGKRVQERRTCANKCSMGACVESIINAGTSDNLLLDINADLGSDFFGSITSTKKITQSIKENTSLTFNKLTIQLKKNNFPTDAVKVSIQKNANIVTPLGTGEPDGIELASAIISNSLLNNSMSQYTLQLNNLINFNSNEKFWVVIERTGNLDDSNYYTLAKEGNDPYVKGEQYNYVGVIWKSVINSSTGTSTPINVGDKIGTSTLPSKDDLDLELRYQLIANTKSEELAR